MWFNDKDYGDFFSVCGNVASSVNKTGHPRRGQYNSQSKQRYVKYVLYWKTQKELQCASSYEVAFVNWCNKNQIDFDWQIPYKMPNGKRYYVDAFIKTGDLANTWIEIKGTWARRNGHIGKAKWEWFHSQHPDDSQIWFKKELQDRGIL